MGLSELISVGFFEAFWNFSSPFLSVLAYLCVLLGALFQWLISRKYCSVPKSLTLIGILLTGAVLCDIATIAITGWERIGMLVLYGCVLSLLAGAILLATIYAISKRKPRGN